MHLTSDDWAAFADTLMERGDRLAEQLRNPRSRPDAPWTQQILDEWAEAKNIIDHLPDPADTTGEDA